MLQILSNILGSITALLEIIFNVFYQVECTGKTPSIAYISVYVLASCT